MKRKCITPLIITVLFFVQIYSPFNIVFASAHNISSGLHEDSCYYGALHNHDDTCSPENSCVYCGGSGAISLERQHKITWDPPVSETCMSCGQQASYRYGYCTQYDCDVHVSKSFCNWCNMDIVYSSFPAAEHFYDGLDDMMSEDSNCQKRCSHCQGTGTLVGIIDACTNNCTSHTEHVPLHQQFNAHSNIYFGALIDSSPCYPKKSDTDFTLLYAFMETRHNMTLYPYTSSYQQNYCPICGENFEYSQNCDLTLVAYKCPCIAKYKILNDESYPYYYAECPGYIVGKRYISPTSLVQCPNCGTAANPPATPEPLYVTKDKAWSYVCKIPSDLTEVSVSCTSAIFTCDKLSKARYHADTLCTCTDGFNITKCIKESGRYYDTAGNVCEPVCSKTIVSMLFQ